MHSRPATPTFRFLPLLATLVCALTLAACDSGGDDGGGGGDLPENFQEGWVLEFVSAEGAEYEFDTAYPEGGSGQSGGSGIVSFDPGYQSAASGENPIEVDFTYLSAGDGDMDLTLYFDSEQKDEASLDEGDTVTLSGSP